METVIDGVTYCSKSDPNNYLGCAPCAGDNNKRICSQFVSDCLPKEIYWVRKDTVREQVEVNKAFGHQMPLFPEIEPPVTAEEDEAFNDLSKAQKDYIKAIGTDPLDLQVGGNHYKMLAIQPIEYITKNNLGYCEANVVKYISRWRDKGGKKDLEKAKHYIDLLIQLENL